MGRAFEYRRASKEARWDRMSKIFPKLSRAITMAVKEAGSDPESNSKLRLAIANAKAQNMPKDNVESAIKRAAGKDSADYAEVNYEGKGPHGVLVFIESATDNTNRTVSNLKTIFNKAGGQIVPTGSLEFLFNRKSVIEFIVPEGQNLEDIELALIDAGLEELEVADGRAYAYGDFKDFGRLNQGVIDLGITPSKSSLKRIPNAPQEFSDEQIEAIETFIDKLEDDEDVQAVYTNIA
jgi:YebC/PmpR family DNA-binding regulatory protein